MQGSGKLNIAHFFNYSAQDIYLRNKDTKTDFVRLSDHQVICILEGKQLRAYLVKCHKTNHKTLIFVG